MTSNSDRPRADRSRPSVRAWPLAAVEVLAAIAVARMILWSNNSDALNHGDHRSGRHEHHHMGSMPSTSSTPSPSTASWGWLEFGAIAVSVLGLAWWLVRRTKASSLIAAAGLATFAASPIARTWATQSHLIAMVALEILLVFAPLLAVRAVPMPVETQRASPRRGTATVFAIGPGLLYGSLLIVVHVPAVHHRAAERGVVPIWVATLALLIGVAYWAAVLRTGGMVTLAVRRSILIGAQEVAAFIGLLSLFGAWGAMAHKSPLDLSSTVDQRLGGLFMMVTCGVVAIPIAAKLRLSPAETGDQRSKTRMAAMRLSAHQFVPRSRSPRAAIMGDDVWDV